MQRYNQLALLGYDKRFCRGTITLSVYMMNIYL